MIIVLLMMVLDDLDWLSVVKMCEESVGDDLVMDWPLLMVAVMIMIMIVIVMVKG